MANALLSILFVLGLAIEIRAADPASCNVAGTLNNETVLNTKADIEALTQCHNITGSTIFGPDISGNLVFPNTEQVYTFGYSMLVEPQKLLTGLSLPKLKTARTLYLQNMDALKTLDISSLTYVVAMNIYLSSLTSTLNLTNLVGPGDQTTSNIIWGIDIVDTQTESITLGHSIQNGPSITEPPRISIMNNLQLQEVVIYAGNITRLEVESPSVQLTSTRGIIEHLLIGNCSVLEQVGLASIGGDLTVYNSLISDQIDLASLESVGGSVTFINNTVVPGDDYTVLTGVQGNLKTIGTDLVIANSGANQNISLSALETVGGMVNITGDIANLSFPVLTQVLRGFSVISTHADFNCSFFDNLHKQLIIRDPYTCKGGATSTSTTVPTTSSTTPVGSKTSLPSSESSTPPSDSHEVTSSAKIGIGLGVGAFVLILAALATWFVKKRKKSTNDVNSVDETAELADYQVQKSELGLGKHHEKVEMNAEPHPQELASKVSSQEPAIPTYYEMPGDDVVHSGSKVK